MRTDSPLILVRRDCNLLPSMLSFEYCVACCVRPRLGVMTVVPDIAMLVGETHRERVLTSEEESKYLAMANPMLSDVAAVLMDTAMRPEECFRQRWEHINWTGGRYGTVLVTHGKTESARRFIPLTPRASAILRARW